MRFSERLCAASWRKLFYIILYYYTSNSQVAFHYHFPNAHILIASLYNLSVLGASLLFFVDMSWKVCELSLISIQKWDFVV